MPVRVSYTQRGFRDKTEYEVHAWDPATNNFRTSKLSSATVKCKNPACLRNLPPSPSPPYTIDHIEQRDLTANPIVCTCGGTNISITYFKTNKLPLIYIDENHKNASLYNNYIKDFNDGKIHPNFASIINLLKHPDFYYGAEDHAKYVDVDDLMMDEEIEDEFGFPRKWLDFPWKDITLMPGWDINTQDPTVLVGPLRELDPIPSMDFINRKGKRDTDGNLIIPYQVLCSDFKAEYCDGLIKTVDITERSEFYQHVNSSSSTGVFTPAYDLYKVYWQFKTIVGSLWRWTDLSDVARTEIQIWETDTNQTFSRNNQEYPKFRVNVGTEILMMSNSTIQSTPGSLMSGLAFNATHLLTISEGQAFIGEPATTITLFEPTEVCDCKSDDPNTFLPGVSDELEHGFDLPPIPLYVNAISGAGSTNTYPATDTTPAFTPTNYSKATIDPIRSKWNWIPITNIEREEGTQYKRVVIQGKKHLLINRLTPANPKCPPCLGFNNHMFSCVFYIITQVDLEDPIY